MKVKRYAMFGIVAIAIMLFLRESLPNASFALDRGFRHITDRTSHGSKQILKSSILFYTAYLNVTSQKFGDCCKVTLSMFDHEHISMSVYEARKRHLLKMLGNNSVIVFHVKDMPGSRLLKEVSQLRPRHQLWAYYNKESPFQTINLRSGKYDDIFNLSITPVRGSDVTAPYGYFLKKSNPTEHWLKFPLFDVHYKNAKHKVPTEPQFSFSDKKVVNWVVSNCNRPRDTYVRELTKHVPIDIFGKCSSKFSQLQKCAKNSLDCELKLRQYKFSIAFENSFCNDYITEKYWDALYRGSVPIVLGGESYDENVIPGSFIDARSFSSAKSLAAYILNLAENKQQYQKYQRWRNDYVLDYTPNDPQRLQYIVSKLHELIRAGFRRKTYKLSVFYGARKNCPLEINNTFWKF